MLNLSQKKRNLIGNIMSKTNEYNIKDMVLADQGLKRINWAKSHMPIMRNLISRLEKEKPFEGLTIGICLHVEAKTGVWVEALTRGGAKIAVTGSPGSTQDETAAALVKFFGAHVYYRLQTMSIFHAIQQRESLN